MHPDVIIVGLGTMGVAAAHALAGRGLRVVGLDQFAPPHDRGAHAGGTRMFRTAYMEGAAYVPLVRESLRLWGELEAETGAELVVTTGGLMLGRTDSAAVAGALHTARTHDLSHELFDATEVRRRFPMFTPADDEVGLWEQGAGFIRPEAAITGLADAARRRGADLRPGVTVTGWTAGPGGVTVHCGGDDIDGGGLVLAPGAWAASLTRLAVPLRVERRVQHFWKPADPALFEPGRLPVWIWEHGDDQAYGMPTVDGQTKAARHHFAQLAERNGGHGGGDVAALVDPSVGAAPALPEEAEAMRGWLEGRIPSLARGAWLGAKPCLYTLTPDEHFVVGRHPEHPTVAVACGFSGHGFKFAPLVGSILADLTTDGRTSFDITPFDPARFA